MMDNKEMEIWILAIQKPQKDDGGREALKHFLEEKNNKLPAFLDVLVKEKEFFKVRVLLELIWEYEAAQKTKDN